MLQLKVAPKAQSDLVDSWPYTHETWDSEQADRHIDQIDAVLPYLATHPLLGVDYSHVLADYRKLRIQHHDFFYRIAEPDLLIVRVLHGDMDAPRRLRD